LIGVLVLARAVPIQQGILHLNKALALDGGIHEKSAMRSATVEDRKSYHPRQKHEYPRHAEPIGPRLQNAQRYEKDAQKQQEDRKRAQPLGHAHRRPRIERHADHGNHHDQADDLGRPAERESRWSSIGRSLSPPFDKGQQQEEEAGNGDG
jgi:hypothetical protein